MVAAPESGASRLINALLLSSVVFVGAAVPCAAGAAAPTAEPSASAARAPRSPNVVLYLIDTLRADHLNTYGYNRDTAPALDALAREGIVFENAYAQSSWTKASVGSLFTGLLPSRHGAVRRDHRLRDDAVTLAESLSAAGYRTAAFVSNPNVLPVFGFAQGFDDVFDIDSVMRQGTADRVHAAVYEYLEKWKQDPGAEERPLLLYVHTRDPHAPYDPPKEYKGRFPVSAPPAPYEHMQSLYDGEIAFADAEISRFLERLREAELYDDTLIILLSDHGEEFGDHGSQGHGRTLFEEQLRVPLIVRLPGAQHAGTRVKEPVRLVDVLPTLLDLLSLTGPDDLDGQSFRPILIGRGAEGYEPALFAELDLDGVAVRSLRSDSYKLIERTLPAASAGTWLYDLEKDPAERNDLAASEPSVVRALRARIAQLDSTLTGGTYVAFSNAVGLDEAHEVRGKLEVIGGTFSDVQSSALEDGDFLRLLRQGDTIEVSLSLHNAPNPIGQNPAVIVDVDQVRFAVEPPDARVRLVVDIDGAPLRDSDVVLGPAALAVETEGGAPPEFSASAPEAELASPSLAQGLARATPYVRAYTVPAVRAGTVPVDRDLDARLRALGYLGEDSPGSTAE